MVDTNLKKSEFIGGLLFPGAAHHRRTRGDARKRVVQTADRLSPALVGPILLKETCFSFHYSSCYRLLAVLVVD